MEYNGTVRGRGLDDSNITKLLA
uniref:Uncharacterized protein n=1 Tax=Arundo donax TaxID=35708 RepID=A0A0A9GPI8_ARUDO